MTGPEFAYNYAIDIFKDEAGRYKRLEEKGGRLLSLTSVAITIYTLAVGYLGDVSSVESCLAFLKLVLVVLAFCSLVTTWGYLYRSLRFVRTPNLPINERLINELVTDEVDSSRERMAEVAVKCCLEAEKINNKKVKYLERAHTLMLFSMIFIVTSILLLII